MPIPRLVLEAMGRMLTLWGYEPVPAPDGSAAWAALTADDGPQIALLDWRMPGMDGVAICRALARHPCARFRYLILVTGHGTDEGKLMGLESGARDSLRKPLR